MEKVKLTMEITEDGRIDIQCENMSMTELVTFAGVLQEFAGLEAVKRGKTIEDVKDYMLDVHLTAMQSLAEKIVRERKEAGSD